MTHTVTRRLRRLLLLAVAVLAVPLLPTSPASAGAPPRIESLPVLSAVGSLAPPDGWGVFGSFLSTDGMTLFGVTYGNVVPIDLASYTALDPLVMTGMPRAHDRSPDGTTEWFQMDDYYGSGKQYVQPVTLSTGVVGTALELDRTTYSCAGPNDMTVGAVGGVNMAFIYCTGPAAILAVNLDTGATVANRIVTSDGFANDNYRPGIDLAADGSALYVSGQYNVKAYDPTDLTVAPTTISAPGYAMQVFDDDTSSASNKGHLYTVNDDTLTIYDLDLDSVIRTVTITSPLYANGFRSIDVASNGDAAITQSEALLEYVVAATGDLISVDFSDATRNGYSNTNTLDVYIDENPTYGTCIFMSNNYDTSYSAISKDGADCGPFGKRFGTLADIAVDGSSTLTYNAPADGARTAPWVAIAVFDGCTLLDVIEPPFSGTLTLDWADFSSTTVSVRGYNATVLDIGGISDLNTLTCDDASSEEVSAHVEYLPFDSDVVGAGGDNSCSAADDASWCWGDNGDGQLGNGSTDGELVPVPTAAPTASGIPVPNRAEAFDGDIITQLDSGEAHTCALAGGKVYCWGDNGDGQLGDGTTDSSEVPTLVSANDGFANVNVTDLSVGKDHTCAIEAAVVYCWGYNSDGEVGDGTTDETLLPTKVVDVPSVFTNAGVTSVGAGFEFTCAIASGELFCWGDNGDGEHGDGTTDSSTEPVKAIDNPTEGFTNSGLFQVVASDESSCVLAAGGVVFCMGYDDYGKLGWDNQGDSEVAVKVLDNPDEEFTNDLVSWLSAGEDHICAIRSGVAFCWGYNSDGQLGNGTEDDSGLPVMVLGDPEGFTNESVTDIDAGYYHTCAIDAGKAYCWGDGSDGKLGNGSEEGSSSPVAVCCSGGGGGGGGDGTVTITTTRPGGGGISVDSVPCALPCSYSGTLGSSITLTAVPAPGYRFVGWTGACSGTGPCVLNVADGLDVGAVFELIPLLPETGSDRALPIFAAAVLLLGLSMVASARRRHAQR